MNQYTGSPDPCYGYKMTALLTNGVLTSFLTITHRYHGASALYSAAASVRSHNFNADKLNCVDFKIEIYNVPITK